jgi:ribosomal protein S18 acetylase RimI-like enzyme
MPATSDPAPPATPGPAPLAVRAAAPDTLPVPTAGGLTYRGAGAADAAAVAALQNAVLEADGAPHRTSEAEVRDDLTAPWTDPAADWLLGVDGSGEPRAWMHTFAPPGDVRLARGMLHGGVHPGWRGRGVGREVLAWGLGRARQLLAASGKELPARLQTWAEDDAPAAEHRLLERAGLAPVRYWHELRRDLAAPVPDVTPADGLRLVPWAPGLDDATRLAHNDAFRDHWGSEPQTAQQWRRGATHHEPGWSFLVLDEHPDVEALLADPDTDEATAAALRAGEPLVVGYHMASRYTDSFAARGYPFGYSDLLGARRAYRGRRAAVAALAAGLRAMAADGMREASLDVDTANPSGATGLYASLGYVKASGSRTYALDL